MTWSLRSTLAWLFGCQPGARTRLIPRWLFLRALGAIYFSAFFSLLLEIRGLIGPSGILPAGKYLQQVQQAFPHWQTFWYAPTLLWHSSGRSMLVALCWIGLAASSFLILNLWPRATLVVAFVCFLSFVSAAQDFSEYQSDGMLLEAGAISFFFAPPGLRPGLGWGFGPSRASLFLLQWEWFRIYFQSGVVKLLSGDPQWRNFTAMDEYYQNGPLPTWIGWYVQQLPHWFHAATVYATLALELGLVWMLFLGRRWRIACFLIVTVWQVPVILTANYAFLNYLVLSMGVLLLDDQLLVSFWPERWRFHWRQADRTREATPDTAAESWWTRSGRYWQVVKISLSAILLVWIFYVTSAKLVWMFAKLPLPVFPVTLLEPFRIANQYGLFAVMTRGRYEIEFQGSSDGENWTAYPFRFKPQDPKQPPGIYAPFQPRFDWNLWFASLGSWRQNPIVPNTELLLFENDRDVLALFRRNPFSEHPPRQVRAVLWQYWFTTMAEKRATGMWWRHQMLGLYAPRLERQPDGSIRVIEWPTLAPTE